MIHTDKKTTMWPMMQACLVQAAL